MLKFAQQISPSQLIVSEKITGFQTGGNGGQLGVAKVAHPEEGCVAQQWQTSSRKLGFSGLKVKLRRWAVVSFCSLEIDQIVLGISKGESASLVYGRDKYVTS